LAIAGNLIARLLLDKTNYSTGLKTADSEAKNFQKSGSSSFGMLQAAGVAAFAAIVAATGKAISDASKYEQVLANVSTMVTSNVAPTMEIFNKALLEQSKLLGEDVQTLGKGLYDILSAGITNTGDAMHVLEVSAKAARAGLTDTGVAADALTTIINAYGLEANQAGKVSDILFKTVQRGKTTFAQLAPSVGRVATLSAQAGVSMEEMGAALAIMTRRGVKTDEAITALRGVITGFLKPSEELAEAFGENALQSRGLADVLDEMAGMPPDVLAKFFPNVRGMLGAITAAQDMKSETQEFIDTLKTGSPTMDAFDKQTATFSFTWDQFAKTIEAVSIQVGEQILPVLGDAIRDVTKFINDNEEAMTAVGSTIATVLKTVIDFGGQVFTLVGELAGEIMGFLEENQELVGVFGDAIKFVLDTIVMSLKAITTPIKEIVSWFRHMGVLQKEINVISKEQADRMLDLAGRYDELNKKTNKTTAEKEEFIRVTNELNEILPDSAANLIEEAKAAEIDAKMLLRRNLVLEGQERLEELETKMTAQIKERIKAQRALERANKALADQDWSQIELDALLIEKENELKRAGFTRREIAIELEKELQRLQEEGPANLKAYREEVERAQENFDDWSQAVIDTQDNIWTLERSLDSLVDTSLKKSDIIIEDEKKKNDTIVELDDEKNEELEENQANLIEGLKAYYQFIVKQEFATAEQKKKALDIALKKNKEAAEETKKTWQDAYNEINDVVRTSMTFVSGAVGAWFDLQENLIDTNVKDEKEAKRQKAELAVKEFKFNKAQTLIQIGMDTAAAFVKALPRVVLAGTIAALGAARAIFVAAQKPPAIPSFQGGGFVEGVPGVDANIIRATKGEFVVREEAARNNRGTLEAMNRGENAMPSINLVPVPINIMLSDGRIIGKADLQFIQTESKFGGVLIHPKAISDQV
jgi:TP901 family phage tail tape measure protein